MKNRNHKYFRKQRYNNKLEKRVGANKRYNTKVFFITKEPDSRAIREHQHRFWYYGEEKARGKEYYRYWKRPEISYSIQEWRKDPRESARYRDCRKYTNRRLRQAWKQRGEVYQYSNYKKVYDMWWDID